MGLLVQSRVTPVPGALVPCPGFCPLSPIPAPRPCSKALSSFLFSSLLPWEVAGAAGGEELLLEQSWMATKTLRGSRWGRGDLPADLTNERAELAQHESDAAPWQTPARHNSSCWLQPARKHHRRSSTVSANGDLGSAGGDGGVWVAGMKRTQTLLLEPPQPQGWQSSTSTSGWCKF